MPSIRELGPDAEYYDVEGVPVAVEEVEAFRYDREPPELFSLEGVVENGVPISREQFLQAASSGG